MKNLTVKSLAVPQVVEDLVFDDNNQRPSFVTGRPSIAPRASIAMQGPHGRLSVVSSPPQGRPSKMPAFNIRMNRAQLMTYDVTQSALYIPSNQAKLFQACQDGDIDKVYEAMWDNVSPNISLPVLGTTPLCVSCRAGFKSIASLLIEFGAIPSVADNYGVTPLHWAANSGNTGLIQMLISKGRMSSSDLAKKDSFGSTPLHFAAIMNHTQCVRLLIDCGSDPLAVNNDGRKASDLTTDDLIKSTLVEEESRLLKAIAQGVKQPLRKMIIPGEEKSLKAKKRRPSKLAPTNSDETHSTSTLLLSSNVGLLKASQNTLESSSVSVPLASKTDLSSQTKRIPKTFVSAASVTASSLTKLRKK